MNKQKKEFRLDNHAISMLIQAQAGSLQKAILEAVANALDANSSHVKVDITPNTVTIIDNGRGFQNEEEIEKFFATFGFDHSTLDRKVGRFGVGRGQLFHFGKNLWTTNEFTMGVDTKEDMFGYELGKAKKPHQGVKIEIDLYNPMSFSQLSTVENELKKLVKFSTIPVLLNGKEIHKDPNNMQWDAETDDAWFKFDDSHEMKVYSQGLFVQALPDRQFGKGGIVVTKLGKALKQNMARNDMLITDCEIWKRVNETLNQLSKNLKKKSKNSTTNMTEGLRHSMGIQAIRAEESESIDILLSSNIFTLTNGKHVKLSQLFSTSYIAAGEPKDLAADILISRKQAMIISKKTLHRFEVETVEEFKQVLFKAVDLYEKIVNNIPGTPFFNNIEDARFHDKLTDIKGIMSRCIFVEEVSDLPMVANTAFTEIRDREADIDERLALALIRRDLMPELTYQVIRHLKPEEDISRWSINSRTMRSIKLATSEAFLACTDGVSKIWIERNFLRNCIQRGPKGFGALAHVLTHELLHDLDSSTGHDHDHQFFQAYHDLTLDGKMADFGNHTYRIFLARGGKATKYDIKEMEGNGFFTSQDVTERKENLSNPQGRLDFIEHPEENVVTAVKKRTKMKP